MAEEFVDLYQVLELPIDADRGTVRKRINELYLDAQHNLDHRNFATRVKFQELFEVTLPQARYILLDDGRRDEYNRIVNAFRATGSASGGAPPAPTAAPTDASASIPQSTGGFSLETVADAEIGNAPSIAPLPQTASDPAQLAQEREELWKKWKTGLEAALTVETGDKPKSRAAVTSAPTSSSVATPPDAAPAATPLQTAAPAPPSAPVASQTTPVPTNPVPTTPTPVPTAPKTAARPKVEISFNSDGESAPVSSAPGVEEIAVEHEPQHSPAEIEARRAEHRRQISKDILVNVGLIWGIIGAALVVVPGVAALIATVGHYYPRGAKPLLGYSSMIIWVVGFLLIGIAAFFASRELSKSMRRKKATELSFLSYEELLRQTGKS